MRPPAVDVLVAGAGLAGVRCAESLRAAGFDGSVVVAGDEPHAPYERPPLSKELLLGTRTASSLRQRPEGYHDGLEIVVATSGPVRDVDLGARRALVGDRVVRWRR
ncbi:MAG: FAD-dependent oxidoreductase, partial [Thermoleophilia bacterium]